MPQTLKLPILGNEISGRSRAVTAQKRQNIYVEIDNDADKGSVVAYGTPGLASFTSVGATPIRGMWWYQQENVIIAVTGKYVVEVLPDGSVVEIGQLTTESGSVSIADNGAQVIIVDGVGGYIYQYTTPALDYSRTLTTVTVFETLHTRVTGQVVKIGRAHV